MLVDLKENITDESCLTKCNNISNRAGPMLCFRQFDESVRDGLRRLCSSGWHFIRELCFSS
jgi:hypothetical protein